MIATDGLSKSRVNHSFTIQNLKSKIQNGISYRKFGSKAPSLRQAQDKPSRTAFWYNWEAKVKFLCHRENSAEIVQHFKA
jgi:hypothetical protein